MPALEARVVVFDMLDRVRNPSVLGFRIAVVNSNVPNMLGQISTDLAEASLNIIDMLNKSRGEIAVTLIDVDQAPSDAAVQRIRDIDGVLSVRCLGCT